MKLLKSTLLVFLFLATIVSFSACGENAAADKTGIEYTSAYICPMYCEGSGSDKAGKCPACKMAYMENEDFKGEIKKVEDHTGHDHDNHEGHNH